MPDRFLNTIKNIKKLRRAVIFQKLELIQAKLFNRAVKHQIEQRDCAKNIPYPCKMASKRLLAYWKFHRYRLFYSSFVDPAFNIERRLRDNKSFDSWKSAMFFTWHIVYVHTELQIPFQFHTGVFRLAVRHGSWEIGFIDGYMIEQELRIIYLSALKKNYSKSVFLLPYFQFKLSSLRSECWKILSKILW